MAGCNRGLGTRRLGAADRLWLGLDSPRNLMMVTAVLSFAGPVDLRALRTLLADRLLGGYPRFGQRVEVGRWPLRVPRWRDADVDLDLHLRRLPSHGGDLPGVVEALLSQPLDLTRPPWQFDLVSTATGDALVARVHHCLADGIALAGVLLALTDSPATRRPQAPSPSGTSPAGTLTSVAGITRSALRLLLLRREPRTPLTGRPGVAKRVAFTSGLPLAQVQALAKATGGSVNDVLLAVTAGALRRYLLAHGIAAPDLRIFLPVNVRPAGSPQPGKLGNRFGLLFPRLPVSVADPVARVAAVSRQMTAGKASAEAVSTYHLMRLAGLAPRWCQALAGRVLGSKASAVVTNVPGPRQPVALSGAALSRLTYWVPQFGSVGLGVSIFSYAATVTVGVATDAALVPDPARLTDAMAAEFADLRRAFGVAG